MDAIPEFTRDVLVSIHPKHASKILNGEKTVELRRRFPEASTRGALAVIYSTSPVQAVVGLARIRHALKLPVARIWRDYGEAACVSKTEFYGYFSGVGDGYAIVLDHVWPLKRQVKAGDLLTLFGIVPPQSSPSSTSMGVPLCSITGDGEPHPYRPKSGAQPRNDLIRQGLFRKGGIWELSKQGFELMRAQGEDRSARRPAHQSRSQRKQGRTPRAYSSSKRPGS